MASCKKFFNLVLGSGGTVKVAGDTLATNTTYVTNGVPCKGARLVTFRVRTGEAVQFASAAINQGPAAPRATATFQSSGSTGTTVTSNVGATPSAAGGGLVFQAFPSTSSRFGFDFCQLSIQTHATTAQTAVYVDAEVWYDGDADSIATEAGQQNYTMLTT